MEHCGVEMQILDSRAEEKGAAVFDILRFRCPVCGEIVEKEYERKPDTPDAGSRGPQK